MQHEVVVRNNDMGWSYTIVMNLSEQQAKAVEDLGARLTEESDWSLTMTVTQVGMT